MSTVMERETIQVLMLRICGFSGVLYFFNWLDRSNIGFAALQMNKELGFTPAIYGLAASAFFLGFALFEVPSNMALHRVGARRWIGWITIAWGLVCCVNAAIKDVPSLLAIRFVLGAVEAGFTPGLLLYFSHWFPRKYRARAFGLLFMTPLLAPVIGGPLSGWLMTAMQGVGGVSGWRWMFLLEGLPTVLLGVACFFYLKNSPAEAGWLAPDEKAWLAETLRAEEAETPSKQHASVGEFIGDGRLWALTAVYFFWSMGGYGILFWLPQIINAATGLDPLRTALLNSVPFLFAIAGLLLIGRWSDRTGSRKAPIVVLALGASAALIAAGLVGVGAPALGFALICLGAFCVWGQQAVFWTLPSTYLRGTSAAAGLAVVNTGAACGGFVAPMAVGYIKQASGAYGLGLVAMGATALIVALIVACMTIARTPAASSTTSQA